MKKICAKIKKFAISSTEEHGESQAKHLFSADERGSKSFEAANEGK